VVKLDPLASRIARRVTAETLTKSWLMGVRRGFLSLLKPHIDDYNDVFKALDRLDKFVEDLKEQIRLVRRAPFRHTDFADTENKHKRAQQIETEFQRLQKQLNEARSTARHWAEWMDGTALGYKWGENRKPDAETMLQHYRTTFADTIGGHVPTRVQRSKGKYNTTKFADITGFLDRILKMLYEEAKTIEELDTDPGFSYSESAYSEFDLHGMKVIVNDTSLGAYDINEYVKLLGKAYALLKAKGFEKVWHGTVFIECDACGGVNYNDGGGVGGHFNIQKDWVKIFSRPSSFIVKLMAHELGHRHWYKGMSSGQRARFESLVKVYRKPELRPIDENQLAKSQDDVENGIDDIAHKCKQVAASGEVSTLYWKVRDMLTPIYKTLDSYETGGASKNLHDLRSTAKRHLHDLSEWVNRAYDYVGAKPQKQGGLDAWLEQAFDYTRAARHTSFEYFEAVKKAATPDFDSEDTRTILPVSEYGKSNISEAFAEVFAHYIMGEDLSRDQLESFKAVLKHSSTENLSERIVQRFLSGTMRTHEGKTPLLAFH